MDSPRWYVMLNHHPQVLDFQLQRENVRRRLERHEGLPLLEYFIPYCFLTHLSEKEHSGEKENVAMANSLRQDFHDFVFIHATYWEITQLMDSEWNQAMRSKLRHYRDRRGREVTITEEEKNNLISIFSELRIRFSFGLPVQDIGPNINVRIRKEGSFQGQTARIIEVKHTANGISLKLGISLFNGMKELKLHNFTLQDIQAENTPNDIIGTLFVQDKEQILTDILLRRVRHTETEETRCQDATLLNHTFLYSYVTINDTILSARFLALMLICATLRFDRENVKILTERVCAQLDTRDADYRTAGKQCVQQHPECASDTLRRLMSAVVTMHSKRKRTH